ncbi:uncharacterized protein LOC134094682 [Sardina pilchardus]|uniref:uncharacterized protein LOC134094682 n=1 Tax=Sardina pilchardus TaxID=27697 RepID=UPI002E10C7D4
MDMVSDEREAQFITPPLGTLGDRPSPPELAGRDHFHVFISYSSCDSPWTQRLITWLESPQCGLLTCYHERDFVPGCSILENMTNCIQKSQKVLLVLSQDFVRSRWCLLEANLSLFRDCLERKPLVPVLLEPDITIPMHLCHITYLDAKDPEFHSKLLKVLCTPNHQMQGSSVVPYQPPSVYNGKALQPLSALNGGGGLKEWEAGLFSEGVPDQLRSILHNDEKYVAAIRNINSVSLTKAMSRTSVALFVCAAIGFVSLLTGSIVIMGVFMDSSYRPLLSIYVLPLLAWLRIGLCGNEMTMYIISNMQKCAGQANVALAEEKILMGCESRTKLCFVYVSLEGCKLMFNETFQESALANEMFQRALLLLSPGYAYCLANKHFPFDMTSSHGHLDGGVCFCQYVIQKLKND